MQSNEQKIKLALEMKKALQPKRIVPVEYDDENTNLDLIKPVVENADDLTEDEFIKARRQSVLNQLQDKLDGYKNNFPISVFPKSIQQYIEELEQCLRAPKEYTAASILVAISGAIGNKFHARFKEGWETAPMLYMVLVGSTGANKSMPLKEALLPLTIKEKQYAKEYEIQLRTFDGLKENKKEKAQIPIDRRCVVNDITMEALLDILVKNDVTVVYDEFQGFLNSMNKYRPGGDDMQKWLSIWKGEQFRTDRKGRKGELVENAFANCIGTIQPDVLLTFLNRNNLGNGFNERLLYVTTPESSNGSWTAQQRNSEFKNHYQKLINSIFDIPQRVNAEGDNEPTIIDFTVSAFNAILNWQKQNYEEFMAVSDHNLAGVYKKLDIYVIRFSLIMAVIDFAEKAPLLLQNTDRPIKITEKHCNHAIQIVEYFRNGAKEIFSLKPKDINLKHYDTTLKLFFEELPDLFTTRQAHEVRAKLQMSDRSMYYYLNTKFFKKYAHGRYHKTYKQV